MNRMLAQAFKSSIFSIAFIGLICPAMAQLTPAQQQAIDVQTGTASPGRDVRSQQDKFVPRVEPRVEVQKLQIQSAPPGAEGIIFELKNIVLSGVSVYPESILGAVYADKVKTIISLADLYDIASTLSRKYRNDGYILTQVVVPPQTIENGVARLQVIEGTIDTIEIRGSHEPSMDLVRNYATRIKIKNALNTNDLERALLLINDLPGISARGILNPSPTKAGAADLIIIVERKAYDAQIGIDNHGTRYLGPVQLSAYGSTNSALGQNERITAQFVNAGIEERFHELLYGALTYEQPVWTYGSTVTLGFRHTNTNPGFNLKQFDVEGWSTNMSAEFMHPFIRSRARNLNGRLRFDHNNITTKNNIPVDPTRKDRVRALRLGGTLETIDHFLGVGYNILDAEFSKGLGILGANKKGDLDMSRPAADPSFEKLTAEIQRLQRVTSEVNLLLATKGQISNKALLSSEEFGVGGFEYGRGYDSSEIIGERGISGKVELQWNEPHKFSILDDYQLYSFYDAGTVWNEDATTSAGKRDTITSAGLGIRADFSKTTTAGFMLAFPLNREPQTDNNKSPRVYINLYHRF